MDTSQSLYPPELRLRLANFKEALKQQVKPRRCKINLSTPQRRALNTLRNMHEFITVLCDKNLGPEIIERNEYIRLALVHLIDTKT
jgi:hypothetical protein